jgi:hypothetical protein
VLELRLGLARGDLGDLDEQYRPTQMELVDDAAGGLIVETGPSQDAPDGEIACHAQPTAVGLAAD